jgi:hypothetical protein
MQAKTTMKNYHFASLRMAEKKGQTITNVDKDIRKLKQSYIVEWGCKMAQPL